MLEAKDKQMGELLQSAVVAVWFFFFLFKLEVSIPQIPMIQPLPNLETNQMISLVFPISGFYDSSAIATRVE